MKLQTKFSLWVTALVTAVVCAGAALTLVSERQILLAEMAQHQRQLAQHLAQVCAESFYQNQNDVAVFNYLKSLRSERGLIDAGFMDRRGTMQISSDPKKMGTAPSSPQETEARASSGFFVQVYDSGGRLVRDAATPVVFGSARVGTARLLFSEDALHAFVRSSLKNTLWRLSVICLISLGLGVVGAVLLARTLTEPIHAVVLGMEKVARGNLSPVAVKDRGDELGWMGEQLNVMIGKLKELDEMKRDFVAGITHELKAPLIATDQFLAMMIKGSYGEMTNEQRDLLITLQNNSARLSRLIDDVLTAAKMESDRIDVDPRRIDFAKTIRDVHTLYAAIAQKKNVAFLIEAPASGLLVWADPDKSLRILINLVSNAFKFTERGLVVVRASASETGVTVSIADTGCGIPDEDRARVFEKFFRSRSSAGSTSGTGLGLTIVKGLVEAQGGTIRLDKNVGGGAVFTFTLPRQETRAS